MLDRVPAELTTRPQWVLWRWELDGSPVAPQTPKATKVPYSALTGRKASSTNPKTWASVETAVQALGQHHCDGVGFMFSPNDPYTGIDLDDCIDDAGTIAPWAWEIVQTMHTYTEISPSGHGLKLWVIGDVPKSIKTDSIEIYNQARYFTVTGQQLPNTPDTIRSVGAALDALYQSLKKPEKAPPQPSTIVDDSYLRVWADQVIESAISRMKTARAGAQHNTRLAMGRLLGGLIHLGLMNEDRAFRLIYDANIPDANDATERKAILDGIASGRGDPLTPPPQPPQPLFKDKIAYCPVHKTQLPRAKNGNGYKCHERDESTVSGWCDFWWKGGGYIESPPQNKPAEPAQKQTEYVHTKVDWRAQGITLRELQHKVFDPERWIIEGIFPEGACLIAAKYKSKKSWLALALSLPVSMGGRALGRLLVHAGRVLYLDLEGRQQRIKKRTRAILGVQQVDWPDNFHVFTKWPRGDEGMRELEYWFASYPDTVLVIIDVLASFRRPMDKNEMMYQYDRDTVDPINELAEKHHAGIALIHHFNKGKHDDIMDAITGSTGLPSAVNTMWALRRDVNDSNITILEMRGRDLENDDPLALRWDTYLNMHVIEGPANEIAISTERRAITQLLSDDLPRTPKEIASELGRSVPGIQQLLRKLLNDGLIDKPGYGKYALVRKPDQSDQSDQGSKSDQGSNSDRDRPTLIGPLTTDQSSLEPQKAVNSHSDHSDRDSKGAMSSNGVPADYAPSEAGKKMAERIRKLKKAREEQGQ